MREIVKLFTNGSVIVFGSRGSGKDMLTSNVVARRKMPYVANIDYGGKYIPLDFDKIDVGKNTYLDFIEGSVKKYIYPYPDKCDIYISDMGVYLPAQYCNELTRKYPYLPVFYALSRHCGDCSVHGSTQALNRVYDKIREQAEVYIHCKWCKVFFGRLVLQKVTIYDKYESALSRQEPFQVPMPLFASEQTKSSIRMQRAQYYANHGRIKRKLMFYIHKGKYDTRYFREVLKNGI